MNGAGSGIRRVMQKTPSRTNNYFVVRGFRIVPPAPETATATLDADTSDAALLRKKCERIAARPPVPVDWARYFFFEDTDPVSTLRAYDSAKRLSASIAAFRTPPCSGPWGTVAVVGEFPEAVN